MNAAALKTAISNATFAEGFLKMSGVLALMYFMTGLTEFGSTYSFFYLEGPKFLEASGFLVRFVSYLSSFVLD